MYKRMIFLFIVVFLPSVLLFGDSITWTEEDVKFFQNKEYTGDKENHFRDYNSIDFYPPYL